MHAVQYLDLSPAGKLRSPALRQSPPPGTPGTPGLTPFETVFQSRIYASRPTHRKGGMRFSGLGFARIFQTEVLTPPVAQDGAILAVLRRRRWRLTLQALQELEVLVAAVKGNGQSGGGLAFRRMLRPDIRPFKAQDIQMLAQIDAAQKAQALQRRVHNGAHERLGLHAASMALQHGGARPDIQDPQRFQRRQHCRQTADGLLAQIHVQLQLLQASSLRHHFEKEELLRSGV
eukprot:scaffold7099_cov281-Pinguiococcus_pyrenoidosus.AAC.24